MKRKYSSDSHKRVSEVCQKEVAEMLQQPVSFEQAKEQVERNAKMSFQED